MWKAYPIKSKFNITAFYTLFERVYKYDFTYPGETHNFWECLYVVDGDVIVSGDDRVYNMTTGDIIFHKPLEMHKFTVKNPKGAHLFIFSFSTDSEAFSFFENKIFSLNKEEIFTVRSLLDYMHNVKNVASVKSGYNYISYTFDELFIQTVMNYIYKLFLLLYENQTTFKESSEKNAVIYKKAVNYMNSEIYSKISVLDIANFCSVSETTLKRIFAEYAGIGIHKYYLKLKIKEAITLLSKDKSVTEVAEMLSFSSQGYFSLTFKRETGYTPSEYLKRTI